jgi:multiple sugar transport system substrate-binding protein
MKLRAPFFSSRVRHALMLGTSALLLLGACRPGVNDKRVHLRLTWGAGNPAETGFAMKMIDEFNASHPHTVVSAEPVGGTYYAKLLTMLAAKTAPDVFVLDSSAFKPFLAKNVLLPLNGFMQRSAMRSDDFLPVLVNAFSSEGQLYGIPKDFNTLGLFYNKSMFDRAGLSYPDGRWDLAQVRRAALALNRPQQGEYGFLLSRDNVERFGPIAFMYGADFLTHDGHSALRSPEALAAMNFYAGLARQDHVAVFPSDVGTTWTGDAFGKQAAAMGFEGGWLIPYLQESFPKLRYGIAELPTGPKGHANYLFTAAYVIPRACPRADAAWELVEFLTSAQTQARVTFALPSRKTMSRRYASEHPLYQPLLASAAYAKVYDLGPQGERIKGSLVQALEEIFLNNRPPAEALNVASDEIDRAARL